MSFSMARNTLKSKVTSGIAATDAPRFNAFKTVWIDDRYCTLWDNRDELSLGRNYVLLAAQLRYQEVDFWVGNLMLEKVTLENFVPTPRDKHGWAMLKRNMVRKAKYRPIQQSGVAKKVSCQVCLSK